MKKLTYNEAKIEFAKSFSNGDFKKAFEVLELLEKYSSYIKELKDKGLLEFNDNKTTTA